MGAIDWAVGMSSWLTTPLPNSPALLEVAPLTVGLAAANIAVYTVLISKFSPFLTRGESPFVPTSPSKLSAMFGEDGCLRPGGGVFAPDAMPLAQQHLVDLGSGDGAVVRAAARVGGFGRATGYETNPGLVRTSKAQSEGRAAEEFHLRSLWDAPLEDADAVVLYIIPSTLVDLAPKLGQELRDGAVVVSNRYPLPETPELQLVRELPVETPLLDADASSSLYCYRVNRS